MSRAFYSAVHHTRILFKGLVFTTSILIPVSILIRHGWLREAKIHISKLKQGGGGFSG